MPPSGENAKPPTHTGPRLVGSAPARVPISRHARRDRREAARRPAPSTSAAVPSAGQREPVAVRLLEAEEAVVGPARGEHRGATGRVARPGDAGSTP